MGVGGTANDEFGAPLIVQFDATGAPDLVDPVSLPLEAVFVSAAVDVDGSVWATGTGVVNGTSRWLWAVAEQSGRIPETWTFDLDSEGGAMVASPLGTAMVSVGRSGAVLYAYSHPIACLASTTVTCKSQAGIIDWSIAPPNNGSIEGHVVMLDPVGAAALVAGTLMDQGLVYPMVGIFIGRDAQRQQLGTEPGAVTSGVLLDRGVLLGGTIEGANGPTPALWRVGGLQNLSQIDAWGRLVGGGVFGLARLEDHVFVLQTTEQGSTLTKCGLDGVDCR